MLRFVSYIFLTCAGFILVVMTMNTGETPTTSNSSVAATVNPCSPPITYQIGSIDSRYDLTRRELKKILKEVEQLWETALNRDLLNYQSNGNVAVYLNYTEKQKLTEQEQQFSKKIETIKEKIAEAKSKYERLKSTYQNQQEELQSMISHYEQVVKNFNEELERWKQKGGIPRSKKPQIERQKRRIRQLEKEIDKKEQNVQSYHQRANQKSKQLNDLIARQNRMIVEYNRKFAKTERFNQGNYVKKGNVERINIFQFANRGKLKAVLAHEFGHAMGIGHVSNPRSIMHEVMKEQNIYDLSLTKEDVTALKKVCGE